MRLGGVGDRIAAELSERLHSETRSMLLGHLQRGGGPTPIDRFLATQYGVHAMRLQAEGKYGRMVCYQPPAVSDVAIADAIGQLNKVDPLGAAVQTARGLGITSAIVCPIASRSPFSLRSRCRSACRCRRSEISEIELLAFDEFRRAGYDIATLS